MTYCSDIIFYILMLLQRPYNFSCNHLTLTPGENFNMGPNDYVKYPGSDCTLNAVPDAEQLTGLAFTLGAGDAKIISSAHILVENHLADFCKPPQCKNYGLSPSCPPHVGGPQAFRELQKRLPYSVIVRLVVPSAALFSDEKREIMQLLHEIVAGIENKAVKMKYTQSKAFAGGSCKKIFCHDHSGCQILEKGGDCRHPDHARPSMSGFGINVSELMKVCGWPSIINTRKPKSTDDTMTWVAGMVMVG